MNKVILCGRLTADPEIKYSTTDNKPRATYTLAVDRRGQEGADFIRCVAFGKSAEFVENYLHKGMKILVVGRLNINSSKNQDGTFSSFTSVIVDEHEFVESRGNASEPKEEKKPSANDDWFKVDDSGLPFN